MLTKQHLSEGQTTKSYRYFALERAGDVLIVGLGQRLGSLCGLDLLEERTTLIEEIGDPGIRAVVFDFARVQCFDSLVLDTLCQVWKRLRERDAKMALRNLSKVGNEVLRACRFDALWRPHPSRRSAFEALWSTENVVRLP
jgi:anti-anti-sigma regulatory factor